MHFQRLSEWNFIYQDFVIWMKHLNMQFIFVFVEFNIFIKESGSYSDPGMM